MTIDSALNDPDTGLLRRPRSGGPQDIFYARRFMTNFPTIVRGDGIYLWDDAGNRYIDAISGAFVSNLGQGNVKVADAIAEQAKRMTFTYVRYARHLPNMRLSAMIAELAGPGFERCLLVSGGSEANDMAIKLLRQYALAKGEVSRRKMISLSPSFHGNTLGTIAVTGDDDALPVYGAMVEFSRKIPAPMTYRRPPGVSLLDNAMKTVEALESAIIEMGPENVLGFIYEPVGGVSTGAIVQPDEYYGAIRRVCDKYGVRVILDEVMSAFRIGHRFAAHRWPAAKPDLIVVAKGLGAGYVPLGAVLAPAEMIDELSELTGFNPSHTFNANPVCCAGGVAVLEETARLNLVDNARDVGTYLRSKLEGLKSESPIIGDVRGMGLLTAVELVTNKESKAPFPSEVYVSNRLRLIGLQHGLILYARRQSGGKAGEWSMIGPPLTTSLEQIDDLVDRLRKAISQLADEMTREGFLRS